MSYHRPDQPAPAEPPVSSPANRAHAAPGCVAPAAETRADGDVAALSAPGAPFATVRGEDGRLRYVHGPRTLIEVLEATRGFGTRTFLVAEDGTTYSYAAFQAAAAGLARRLSGAYGLRPGDRAVIAGRNRPEWQVAFWAAQLAGLVAVPLNAWWTAAECAYALDDCAPGILLVDGERAERLAPWARSRGVPGIVFHGDPQPGFDTLRSDTLGLGTQGSETHGWETQSSETHGLETQGSETHDSERQGSETRGEEGYGSEGHRLGAYGPEGSGAGASGPEGFDGGIAGLSAGAPRVVVRPADDATITYTSGTTGRPKGAVATHLAQAAAAVNPRFQAAAAALERGGHPGRGRVPVSLTTFPFFHAAAFTSLYGIMAAGGTLVMMRKWDADTALDLIDRYGATHYAGVPATALQLLDAAEARGHRLPSLTNLNTGGAPAPPSLVRRLTAAYGERIEPRNGYGLTETCGGVLAHYGDAYRRRPDSVGRPTPVTETRIAGPDGRPLPVGEVGELWLRGQSLVRGYWRDERATADAFTDDGWFRTGDLALVREDGRVSVVDRIKDVVIRGGENVYCVEVEAALFADPAVADAAVLGVPHPVLGEEVAAVVRPRTPTASTAHRCPAEPIDSPASGAPGRGGDLAPSPEASGPASGPASGACGPAVTADALRDRLRTGLAPFKVPAHILVRDAPLPRNAAGKVLKDRLRKEVVEALTHG
ncbi:class I adenylate-forming enzyme family protein [Streptomyces sp. CC53]|uniref:class I adenylate-forming enzyme family protein n=1 Tax=unclassified Streptomyces TaxID=2593676 RepID=UPI000A72F16D